MDDLGSFLGLSPTQSAPPPVVPSDALSAAINSYRQNGFNYLVSPNGMNMDPQKASVRIDRDVERMIRTIRKGNIMIMDEFIVVGSDMVRFVITCNDVYYVNDSKDTLTLEDTNDPSTSRIVEHVVGITDPSYLSFHDLTYHMPVDDIQNIPVYTVHVTDTTTLSDIPTLHQSQTL